MSKYGAIDIGTNSVRLLIGTVNQRGKLVPVATGLFSTRLGEKMWEKPMLTEAAIDRTITALKKFKEILIMHQVERVRVVATSAVRDSHNQQEFVNKVKEEVALIVEVIAGEEEAALGYAGVLWEATIDKPILMLDIGGGSTEFLFKHQNKIVVESINIGAVRLTGSPVTEEKLESIINPVAEKLTAIALEYHFVGVGGTVTTVVAIAEGLDPYDQKKVHGYRLALSTVKEVREMLARLPLEKRKQVPGLMPERADIIVTGLDILTKVMELFGRDEIEVSEADILYGLILAQQEVGPKL